MEKECCTILGNPLDPKKNWLGRMKEYDLIILGAGAAGFAAAIKASEIIEGKANIAMIYDGYLGGTCVNVGCVPSKYLLDSSNVYFHSKKADLME